MSRVQVIFFLASLLVTGYVLEQVRRRRMALEYSIIWIIAGAAMIILSLWRNSIEYIAGLMGIYYAPSALFVIFGVIVLALSIHFTKVLSQLSTHNRVLVQRVAILENELESIKEDAAKMKN